MAKGALEGNLVIAGGLALADRARVAKERVEGFFRGASEKVTAALAIGSDERSGTSGRSRTSTLIRFRR